MPKNIPNPEAVSWLKESVQSRPNEPLLMLNLNKYTAAAEDASSEVYVRYLDTLNKCLGDSSVQGCIIWKAKNFTGGPAVVGDLDVSEVLAVWYPSPKHFLNIMQCSAFKEFGEARDHAVEIGRIICLPGSTNGLQPPIKGTNKCCLM